MKMPISNFDRRVIPGFLALMQTEVRAPARSVYAASKLGMVGMMRTLALELGRYGVRVNLISPGFVEGPRLDGVIAQVASQENTTPGEMQAKWLEMIPTGRFISPENIAQGVLFFATGRSGATTGEDLNISGGLVMY